MKVTATLRIVNIVAKATLDKKIDLASFKEQYPQDVKYGPDYHGGRFAHFKSIDMQGLVAVWLSGKMIGLGTKSTSQAVLELEIVAKKLNVNFKVNPSISNIVSLVDLGSEIDVDTLIANTSQEKDLTIIYEPEQFPGIIAQVQLPNRKVSMLIFSSGKIVLPGLKTVSEIETVFEKCFAILGKYIFRPK